MIQDSMAAASATVGTNLANGKYYFTSPRLRHLKGVALVGSVAKGDCAVDIYIGGSYQGTIFNSQGGANLVPNKDDIQPFDVGILPNEPLEVKVKTAPGTNPIIWGLDIDEF